MRHVKLVLRLNFVFFSATAETKGEDRTKKKENQRVSAAIENSHGHIIQKSNHVASFGCGLCLVIVHLCQVIAPKQRSSSLAEVVPYDS